MGIYSGRYERRGSELRATRRNHQTKPLAIFRRKAALPVRTRERRLRTRFASSISSLKARKSPKDCNKSIISSLICPLRDLRCEREIHTIRKQRNELLHCEARNSGPQLAIQSRFDKLGLIYVKQQLHINLHIVKKYLYIPAYSPRSHQRSRSLPP